MCNLPISTQLAASSVHCTPLATSCKFPKRPLFFFTWMEDSNANTWGPEGTRDPSRPHWLKIYSLETEVGDGGTWDFKHERGAGFLPYLLTC